MSAIYILDRITLQPGKLDEYRERLASLYLPGARQRGMELVGSWITPPLELDDTCNELVLLWSLRDTAAFWMMRGQAMTDPEVASWWEASDRLTVKRERRLMTSAEILEP
jgi:hypothetical protein